MKFTSYYCGPLANEGGKDVLAALGEFSRVHVYNPDLLLYGRTGPRFSLLREMAGRSLDAVDVLVVDITNFIDSEKRMLLSAAKTRKLPTLALADGFANPDRRLYGFSRTYKDAVLSFYSDVSRLEADVKSFFESIEKSRQA